MFISLPKACLATAILHKSSKVSVSESLISKKLSLFIRDCPLQRASLRLRKCFGCPVCSVLKTNDVYQSNEVLPLARDIVEFINSDPELAKLGSLSVREP